MELECFGQENNSFERNVQLNQDLKWFFYVVIYQRNHERSQIVCSKYTIHIISNMEGHCVRLAKIKLFNYRCFGPNEQTIVIDDLTTFIGNNSSGKTAALAALNCMFSENAYDRQLQRSDFHLPKDVTPEQLSKQSLYIETVFIFDELETDQQEGKLTIPPFFQYLVVDEPDGKPYIRIRMDATWEKTNSIEGAIESSIHYITCPEKAEIADDNKILAHRRDLDRIRVIYVPAVRDPSYQLRNTSGTMMYQIMSSINWSDTTRNKISAKIKELNEEFEGESGVSIFGASISQLWKSYDSDERYSNATLRFNSTDIETAIKKTEVVFLPTETGKEYSIDQMSDGLRSLFYISLVDSILDVENQIKQQLETDPDNVSFNRTPPILSIVAIEEPENHISPHLLGRLIGNLQSIAAKRNAQIIMTSHSPAILKRIEPEALRYFRVSSSDKTTIVRSITLPDGEKLSEQYKYVKEAVKAYPELYFSSLVILGEGDSEEVLLPKFWETRNGKIDLSGISIIPLGGRFVHHFWRLLNDLKIPHITLLDLDRERDGGGWGRIKYVLDQLMLYTTDQRELLATGNGVLSLEELNSMHTWDNAQIDNMQIWINRLENYGVFFSTPLDIDFLMLECFQQEYKKSICANKGPRIRVDTDKGQKEIKIKEIEESGISYSEYDERVRNDVKNTLKEHGGDGSTYSHEQKQLMVWYNYLFLGRGKPSTHFSVISSIDPMVLIERMPELFNRIIIQAEQKIKGGFQ